MPLPDSSPPFTSVAWSSAFTDRPALKVSQATARSPGSRACCFPACLGSLTTEDSTKTRASSLPPMWPSPSLNKVGVLNWFLEALCPACRCLCLRFDVCLATHPARLEVRMDRVSFPVRLFHSLQHAGLSRRTQRHHNQTCLVFKLCGDDSRPQLDKYLTFVSIAT
jgi:hypothetical protein